MCVCVLEYFRAIPSGVTMILAKLLYLSKIFLKCAFPVLFSFGFIFANRERCDFAVFFSRNENRLLLQEIFYTGGAHLTLATGGVQKYQEMQKQMGNIGKKTNLTTYKGENKKNEKIQNTGGNPLKSKYQNWG